MTIPAGEMFSGRPPSCHPQRDFIAVVTVADAIHDDEVADFMQGDQRMMPDAFSVIHFLQAFAQKACILFSSNSPPVRQRPDIRLPHFVSAGQMPDCLADAFP
jgi:hypothetical protein